MTIFFIWNILSKLVEQSWPLPLLSSAPFSSTRISHNHHINYSAAITRYLCTSVPPAVWSSYRNWGGHGIFNARNDLSACCAHEGETGTDESAKMLTWKSRKAGPLSCRVQKSNLTDTDCKVQRVSQPASISSLVTTFFVACWICAKVSALVNTRGVLGSKSPTPNKMNK